MFPAGFDYHAPRSVADAVKLLGQLGPEAKLLAGGHSLLPMMKLRFAEPGHLIDLGRITELRGISQSGNEIRIGAMTTEHELLNSKLLAEKAPLLVEGAGWIADPQVRYKGTLGGDISHGDPANDWLCAWCLNRVASEKDRFNRNGSSEFTFRNPAGIRFDILTFSRTIGCEEAGVPTLEQTWFPGHAWSFCLCARCGQHLGWHYAGATEFAGLIRERIVRAMLVLN